MKTCTIYYFSGTGNTKYVCEKLAEELNKYDFVTETVGIEKVNFPLEIKSDVIGIGYPVHGFNAPAIIDEFVDLLPNAVGTPFFSVKSSGEPLKANDASGMFFMKKLVSKGYKFCGEYHYVMPYNIIFRHSDDMVALMRERLHKKINEDGKEIAKLEEKPLVFEFGAKTIARIVRIEHPAMRMIGKGFAVDESKCLHCSKCVKNCPTKNIRVENGKFIFGSDCLGCMRCAFNCPADAINIGILNKWKVNGKYDFENAPLSENPQVIKYCHKAYLRYFFGA